MRRTKLNCSERVIKVVFAFHSKSVHSITVTMYSINFTRLGRQIGNFGPLGHLNESVLKIKQLFSSNPFQI